MPQPPRDAYRPHAAKGILLARALACCLILQTTLAIVFTYGDYFPPDFQAEFLLGRRTYFYGAYQWAFFAHILCGPYCLLLGLVLMSGRFRNRYPKWHRQLGKLHAGSVLFVLAPSGLAMAGHAVTGSVAAAGFASLAVATATCTALGWQAAVRRRLDHHRRWMERSFALLCSAVVLRLVGGLSEVLGIDGTYPYAAWASWLLPLAALEAWRLTRPHFLHRQSSASPRGQHDMSRG